jgi:hypothetical protein
MNFVVLVMKWGIEFCFRRSDSLFHNESSDFSKTRKICVYDYLYVWENFVKV